MKYMKYMKPSGMKKKHMLQVAELGAPGGIGVIGYGVSITIAAMIGRTSQGSSPITQNRVSRVDIRELGKPPIHQII